MFSNLPNIDSDFTYAFYACLAFPLALLSISLGGALYVGFLSHLSSATDEDREWWSRFGAWVLISAVVWFFVFTLVLMGPALIFYIDDIRLHALFASAGGLSGFAVIALGRGAKTPAFNAESPTPSSLFRRVALAIASPLFVVFIVVIISLLTTVVSTELLRRYYPGFTYHHTWLYRHFHVLAYAPVRAVVVFLAGLSGFAILMSLVIHMNIFSLHAVYRDRLIRAYLGASRGTQRDPDRFTGFDPNDDIDMYRLRPELLRIVELCVRSGPHNGLVARLAAVAAAPGHKNGDAASERLFGWLSGTVKKAFAEAKKTPLPPEAQVQLIDDLNTIIIKRDLAKEFPASQAAGSSLAAQFAPYRPLLNRLLLETAYPGDGSLTTRFAAVASATTSPMNAYLLSKLTPQSLAAIAAAKSGTLAPEQKAQLRKDLHALVANDDFSAIAGIPALPDEYQALLKRIEQFTPLRNRLLLEAEYPRDIPPLPAQRLYSAKPLHVVNITLNLVSGEDLAWQQRKAEALTVTSMHSGNVMLGYRNSRDYGGDTGISLGTAVSISGAAVSPNMGYYTTSTNAILLTLFNVRLGWWLGNPGPAGQSTYRLDKPRSNLSPLINEALGLTDARHPYVYLSDGGHFENLGLYEMVRRRNHIIVLGDGGADPDYGFADLGNAVRKIRIDLGVPIFFPERLRMYPRTSLERLQGRYCAIGVIDYQSIDGVEAQQGVLIYIKPGCYGMEPADILNYATQYPTFPNESTADQWFTESQFESYRTLGSFMVEEMMKGASKIDDLQDFCTQAGVYLGTATPVPDELVDVLTAGLD
jgi:hypothetical protein